MIENLVIVESPAKAKTIEKFLGKDFVVKSSYGHIRDLAKKEFGIDLENNYTPIYVVDDDKKKVISELKKDVKQAKCVWLASDEDREGEAIAWHLYEVLKLSEGNTRRIVFHEITKEAIVKAIQNPRKIDIDLVNAQQARRVLDRLVGFKISPILWKKVKPSLSAGRVQSVAVRLLVDREREIMNFKSEAAYRVLATFEDKIGQSLLKAELNTRFADGKQTTKFLEQCKTAQFTVANVVKKPSKRSPAPPFITSTLQQEASRKLGFSVSRTMLLAQRLYESGHITYMRTDSVNLSDTALNGSARVIKEMFGEKYLNTKQFKTKAKGAQEAHEAIRPTYLENEQISAGRDEERLYQLIWKRTVASQMTDASFEKTTVTIDVSNAQEKFLAQGEVLIFDGFLKLYIESTDDEKDESIKELLPPVKSGDQLTYREIEATQRFSNHPPRYTEASLVRKLEELGIGRPSTYAPTISTIQQRGYVVKEDRPGETRNYQVILLAEDKIKETKKSEITGAEKSKLFPKDIGMVVNDFLLENFGEILNYDFTANVEKEFDEIAAGQMNWTKMIDSFYKPFQKKVEDAEQNKERQRGERVLGIDPGSGKDVLVRIGRFGPMAQIGNAEDEEKPRFASLLANQLMETITLEEALELFKLPRTVGTYENKEMVAAIGRFGPYVRHDNQFYSLKKDVDDPLTVSEKRAIEIIEEKRAAQKNKEIKVFEEDANLKILNGRWGPYISLGKENFKIPKGVKPETVDYAKCLEMIEQAREKKPKTKKK
jgi:DNA topoisomerase I